MGLARRLGASEEQAADVLQEVHLRLWQQLQGGTDIHDVDAWTFRVAYRLVMDQHRLGRRVQDLVGRLTVGRIDAVTHRLDDALSLWPLVDRLPERERATLYLRYRADLSFEQIGQVMGITTASARTYGSRGVERLRALVGDDREGIGAMTFDEIERRLRLPAPDEPAVLPALLLPIQVGTAPGRAPRGPPRRATALADAPGRARHRAAAGRRPRGRVADRRPSARAVARRAARAWAVQRAKASRSTTRTTGRA